MKADNNGQSEVPDWKISGKMFKKHFMYTHLIPTMTITNLSSFAQSQTV